MLIVEDKPTVAGVLIFSDEPQALLPKHCGIKIYRYKASEESNRSFLHDQPITIEGDLYTQIHKSVSETEKIVSSIPKLGDGKSEFVRYPTETLHEILTNAVLYRDYEIKDDIHIRIYDNRVEIQSPGKLPAHITIENILDERYARNGNIVRILNKFKNPPNKDVGEGLNTAFSKMKELGLREPEIKELQNNVLVIIKHESLSSPSEMILEYLKKNESIKNAKVRLITGVKSEHKIKQIFKQISLANQIEKISDTKTSATAWRIVKK